MPFLDKGQGGRQHKLRTVLASSRGFVSSTGTLRVPVHGSSRTRIEEYRMIYAKPNQAGSVVQLKPRYGNYIGGEFVAPVKGEYFSNTSPVDGSLIAEFPRSGAEDIDKALDAAHAAADAWGKTSVQERSLILLKIADRIEANLEQLAVAETWDNGKAVRETLNADIPLAADHFRYFAGCLRAQEGSAAEINEHTAAYHF